MEALQERRVAQRSEKRSSTSARKRRGFLVPRKACGMKELAFLPNLTYQVRKSLSRPDQPHIKLRYQVRGFPWGVLARNRAADRHVVSCATLRGVQPVMVVSLGCHGDRQ
ncbi:unnamed protein product [Sphagnum jensenii]|uniref:Uncharacterized protein n=1 Tax=Sphagnum jensenii TaxID=128206 RepID=A0ABP1ABV9_9BRYO